MECRRVCHVNGAAGHCRLVEGILAVQGRGGCQDEGYANSMFKDQEMYMEKTALIGLCLATT